MVAGVRFYLVEEALAYAVASCFGKDGHAPDVERVALRDCGYCTNDGVILQYDPHGAFVPAGSYLVGCGCGCGEASGGVEGFVFGEGGVEDGGDGGDVGAGGWSDFWRRIVRGH